MTKPIAVPVLNCSMFLNGDGGEACIAAPSSSYLLPCPPEATSPPARGSGVGLAVMGHMGCFRCRDSFHHRHTRVHLPFLRLLGLPGRRRTYALVQEEGIPA